MEKRPYPIDFDDAIDYEEALENWNEKQLLKSKEMLKNLPELPFNDPDDTTDGGNH